MRITRYPSITEPQFFGCLSAFMDSLSGELNSAAMYLTKLEGQPKGAAFAFEMALDTHRYGALIVLDRWATLVHAFGPHLQSERARGIIDVAAGHVQSAENILGRLNDVIDATPQYTGDVVTACVAAFQSLGATFTSERQAVAQDATLGPMLPEDYREARRIFLEDLAGR